MSDGIGVLIQRRFHGSEPVEKYIGRTIKTAAFGDNKLTLTFTDGVTIAVTDEGQSCCETRWITCDDDPAALNDSVLMAIAAKEGPNLPSQYGDDVHEQVFLEISTNKSSISLATHVEHNGYYGGFALQIKEV